MKKIKFLLLVLLGMFLVACGGKEKEERANDSVKVGIVLSTGGLGDKSFNDSAYEGLIRAKEELGIEFKYVEPANPSEFDAFLRDFSEADFDLIVGIGFQMADSIRAVAKDYPKVNYLMVDEPIDLPNVKSAIFDEAEGSFLAGVLASLVSKNGKVGFIGGIEVPLIQRFGKGFFAGAKYVNENVRTYEAYVGGTNPFNDPAKGKEIAISMADQGADIIYHAAAGTGMGLFEAAGERGIYAIGVDSNQDGVRPGVVLTSMLKRVDVAIYEVVKELTQGRFEPSVTKFNVENNGVGLTNFEFTRNDIGEENIAKVEEIKKAIINGEVIVAEKIK